MAGRSERRLLKEVLEAGAVLADLREPERWSQLVKIAGKVVAGDGASVGGDPWGQVRAESGVAGAGWGIGSPQPSETGRPSRATGLYQRSWRRPQISTR